MECLKRIIDRSECVMEVAFRRKEKKRATLGNQRSRADAQEVRQARTQESQADARQQEVRALNSRQGNTLTQAAKNAGYCAEICGAGRIPGPGTIARTCARSCSKNTALGEEILIEKYLNATT